MTGSGIEEALQSLLSRFDRSDVPGVSAGVRLGDVLLHRAGHGLASQEGGTTLGPTTRMRIGSATKQFTCLAVQLLIEQGRIDPDADIRRLLPEMSPALPPISARQLMHHTSGLRCNLDLWMLGTAMLGRLPDEEPLQSMYRQRETHFPAGQRMLYCNGGYVLLARMVERASGIGFGRFLRERVFDPLSMHDTCLLERDGMLLPGAATQHGKDPGDRHVRGVMLQPMGGEGGLVSTVDDLLLWLAHMRRPIIGNRETWAAMHARPRLGDGSRSDYGQGLITRPYRGITLVGHAGAVLGGRCELIHVPGHDLDIVLLSNRSDIAIGELGKQIVDTVLHDRLAPRRRKASPERRSDYAGLYYRPHGGRLIDIAAEPECMIADISGLRVPLQESDEDELLFPAATGDLRFRAERRHDGRVSVLSVRDGGDAGHFRRLEVEARDVPRPTGRYWSPELAAEAELFEESAPGRFLLGVQTRHGRVLYALQPVTAGLWRAHVADGSLEHWLVVESERKDGSGDVFLSSSRTLRLRFTPLPPGQASPLGGDWHLPAEPAPSLPAGLPEPPHRDPT